MPGKTTIVIHIKYPVKVYFLLYVSFIRRLNRKNLPSTQDSETCKFRHYSFGHEITGDLNIAARRKRL